jgi:hypothetical protein
MYLNFYVIQCTNELSNQLTDSQGPVKEMVGPVQVSSLPKFLLKEKPYILIPVQNFLILIKRKRTEKDPKVISLFFTFNYFLKQEYIIFYTMKPETQNAKHTNV